MKWRRKNNFRRTRRTDVLEVKGAGASRRTWGWRVAAALLFALVATLAIHATLRSWSSIRDGLFLSSRFFELQTIEVNTNLVWLAPQQVIEWTGVKRGENLLAVDLDRIRRDLEVIPQVESASVERVLPHLLRVQIRERQPVAQVRGVRPEGGRLVPMIYFLDARARVMPPLTSGRPDLELAFGSLPVIAGLVNNELRVGRDVRTPNIQAALELVRRFPASPMADQASLNTIDVAEGDVLQVTTGSGTEVTLPLTQLGLQLRRWRLVHDTGARAGRTIRFLDLSVTNNCPVLWQVGEPEPAAQPRPVDTTPIGGNHV